MTTALQVILFERIMAERDRQDQKWGEQNHGLLEWLGILGEEYGETSKAIIEHHFGYRLQMLSGEDHSHERRITSEIIQVAAVCFSILECIERNGFQRTTPTYLAKKKKGEYDA